MMLLAVLLYSQLHPVPVQAVKLTDGFWAARQKTNIEKSIPSLLEQLESHGIVDNFRRLSGRKNVARRGPLYTDSDLYKWMEAVAYVLQTERRPALEAQFDAIADDILAAQEPSGYLNTWFQGERKGRRFQEMVSGHELYCLGHLLQAAIAYHKATGKRKLLDGGIRFADYLVRDFGPDKQPLLAGHPEIELALVELYRETGEKKYLDLAGYILRGDGARLKLTASQMSYMFSGRPFTERTFLEGHAVRAGYACAGATDYYLETGDQAYWTTLNRLWNDMMRGKMYLTGGTGSRSSGEAFGDPYELPNAKAYTESCAAISNLFWNWRMLLASGEAKYTDVVERALYNSINSGMSLSGTLYCYRNPLEMTAEASAKIRNPWYDTTCCPPNLERLFASLSGYFYSTSKAGVYVHLYDNSRLDWKLESGTALKLAQATRYPWEGTVEIEVSPAKAEEFTLFLRVPAWSERTRIRVNGQAWAGPAAPGAYAAVKRSWKAGDRVRLELDMRPRATAAHPLAKENQGRVAIERGPIVYLLEQPDQKPGVNVLEAMFRLSGGFTPEFRADLLDGVIVLKHGGAVAAESWDGLPLYRRFDPAAPVAGAAADLTLIPYYGFANRGPAAMQVWTLYTR